MPPKKKHALTSYSKKKQSQPFQQVATLNSNSRRVQSIYTSIPVSYREQNALNDSPNVVDDSEATPISSDVINPANINVCAKVKRYENSV